MYLLVIQRKRKENAEGGSRVLMEGIQNCSCETWVPLCPVTTKVYVLLLS
jgi:hypothetical protein